MGVNKKLYLVKNKMKSFILNPIQNNNNKYGWINLIINKKINNKQQEFQVKLLYYQIKKKNKKNKKVYFYNQSINSFYLFE